MSDALVERLAGVLHTEDVRENPGHADWTTCPTSGPCADLARALLPVVEQEIRRGQHDLAAKVDEAFLALARDLWREAGRAEQRKSHTEAVNLRYAANRISRRLADARAVIIVEVLDCNDDAEEFRRLQNEVVDRLSDLAREDNMRLHLGIDKTADAVMDAFPPQYTLPRDEQEG